MVDTSMITALQVAEARGMKPDSDGGGYSGAAFQAVGIPMMGGCLNCHETLAAYNAYPTKTGYWMCAMDAEMSGQAFETVEEFEQWDD